MGGNPDPQPLTNPLQSLAPHSTPAQLLCPKGRHPRKFPVLFILPAAWRSLRGDQPSRQTFAPPQTLGVGWGAVQWSPSQASGGEEGAAEKPDKPRAEFKLMQIPPFSQEWLSLQFPHSGPFFPLSDLLRRPLPFPSSPDWTQPLLPSPPTRRLSSTLQKGQAASAAPRLCRVGWQRTCLPQDAFATRPHPGDPALFFLRLPL